MKKSLLSAILALAAAAAASAAEFTQAPYTFTTLTDNTVSVTAVDSKDASGNYYTAYDVPEQVTYGGVAYTVTSIGRDAFKWKRATSITLPKTITEIGYGAFNGSDAVSISIPEGVTTIGDFAYSSTKINSFVAPKSLKSIGASAFFTCASLTNVTLNEGLESIGTSAFYKVPATEIKIPETVTSLGDKVFLNCTKLAKVNIPSSIKVIPTALFNGCEKLTEISIAEGVTEIGDEAFLKTALTTITLPASLAKIGQSVFAKTKITDLKLAAGNTVFNIKNGGLYDDKLLYFAPMAGVKEFTVDNSCIGIRGGAFWGSEVEKVTLPEGFVAIDDYVFCQSALSSINFPSTLQYIGEQAFASTGLTEIVLPDKVPAIYDGAFAGCTQLKSVTLPASVTAIFNHAFHNDVNITSFTCLGSTAPVIDDVYEEYDSPFYGISSTTPLYIPAGSTDSYKSEGWNNYFKLTELAPAAVKIVSASPADGTVLGKYADMAVTVTFDSDVTVVSNTPAVVLREGNAENGTVIEPDDCWKTTVYSSNKAQVRFWAADLDSYVQYFSPKAGTDYYLTVPAGVVKNADGVANEAFTITWHGPAAAAPKLVSSTPADNADLPAGYTDYSFMLTFSEQVTVAVTNPEAAVHEGTVDGKDVSLYNTWYAKLQSDKTKVQVYALGSDGYTDGWLLKRETAYYFVLPANTVKNAAGVGNAEIVIKVSNGLGGVDSVEAEALTEVERYDTLGRPVDASHKGLTIVRYNDGSVRKVVVK